MGSFMDNIARDAKVQAVESAENKIKGEESQVEVKETPEKKEEEVVTSTEESSLTEEKSEDVAAKSDAEPEDKTEESQPTQDSKKSNDYFSGEDWAKDNGFYSPEDFEIKLEEELSKKKLSPTLQKYLELEEAGYDITSPSFLRKLNADYSKYNPYDKKDAVSLVRDYLSEQYPDMTQDQITDRIQLKYGDAISGEYETTDVEYKRAILTLEEDASRYKKELEANKIEIKAPESKKEPTEQEKRLYENLVKKGQGQFNRVVSSHLKDNNKVTISYGEESLEFELSDEHQAKLASKIGEVYSNNPNQWLTEKGLNRELIKEDGLKATVYQFMRLDDDIFESMLSKVAQNSKVDGKVEHIKEDKNAQPPEIQSPKGERKKTAEEKRDEEIRQKTSHVKLV